MDWNCTGSGIGLDWGWTGTVLGVDRTGLGQTGSGLGLDWEWTGTVLGADWDWTGTGPAPHRDSAPPPSPPNIRVPRAAAPPTLSASPLVAAV